MSALRIATLLLSLAVAVVITGCTGSPELHAEYPLDNWSGGIGQSKDSTPLTVRVLDVGQGDAVLITSGRSTVLVDGGPSEARLGHLLDSLGLRDTTIDLVIATHLHADHYGGLPALFDSERGIRVKRFAESLGSASTLHLERLRDSVISRMQRGELELLDTYDPCGDGRVVCTFRFDGGAKLHLLKPWKDAFTSNDSSAIAKLVAADSTVFSMWLAGDAERAALEWMSERASYDSMPGMDVRVAKANHHGSCDALDAKYLERLSPEWMVFSLARYNTYGFVHTQSTRMLQERGIRWYRTDQNGTVAITVADGGYTIEPSRGTANATGPSDRISDQYDCRAA